MCQTAERDFVSIDGESFVRTYIYITFHNGVVFSFLKVASTFTSKLHYRQLQSDYRLPNIVVFTISVSSSTSKPFENSIDFVLVERV